MLWNASELKGYTIEANDGPIGTVSDFLFDDKSWTTRWLVVHTGSWLFGRKVLLPLSALGKPDRALRQFPVKLTKQQVEDSPDIDMDLPVSRVIEAQVYNHYDWLPYWRSGMSPMGNAVGTPVFMPRPEFDVEPRHQKDTDAGPGDGDQNLRSVTVLIGYHIEATDGPIGHAEDFLVDDSGWRIGYIVIDTKNWFPGQRVVISPLSIREIDWITRTIYLDADIKKVKASPPYDPGITEEGSFNDRFRKYLGLPMLNGAEMRKLKAAD